VDQLISRSADRISHVGHITPPGGGVVDGRLNPSMAADALGAMVARLAELWLVQGYRDYDFDEAVEQVSILWANALGLNYDSPPGARIRRRRSR
jgi:hypothetical protein